MTSKSSAVIGSAIGFVAGGAAGAAGGYYTARYNRNDSMLLFGFFGSFAGALVGAGMGAQEPPHESLVITTPPLPARFP